MCFITKLFQQTIDSLVFGIVIGTPFAFMAHLSNMPHGVIALSWAAAIIGLHCLIEKASR